MEEATPDCSGKEQFVHFCKSWAGKAEALTRREM